MKGRRMRKLKTLLFAAFATISAVAVAGNYCAPYYNPYYGDGSGGKSCAAATFTEYSQGTEVFQIPRLSNGWTWQVTGTYGNVRTFSCSNGTLDVLNDQGYSDWS
jgi:hypothetical protein